MNKLVKAISDRLDEKKQHDKNDNDRNCRNILLRRQLWLVLQLLLCCNRQLNKGRVHLLIQRHCHQQWVDLASLRLVLLMMLLSIWNLTILDQVLQNLQVQIQMSR